MSDHDMLLAAICADTDDDTVRLAYADEIEGTDPDRTAFIRGQVAGELRTLRLAWLVPFEWLFGCQPHQLGYVAEAGRAWAHQTGSNRRVTFTRGFVEAVACPLADWLAHGPAIVRSHPVTAVRLSDREPQGYHNNGGPRPFGWWQRVAYDNHPDRPCDLPTDLWRAVTVRPAVTQHGWWADFPTAALAHEALSRACLDWAKAAG